MTKVQVYLPTAVFPVKEKRAKIPEAEDMISMTKRNTGETDDYRGVILRFIAFSMAKTFGLFAQKWLGNFLCRVTFRTQN